MNAVYKLHHSYKTEDDRLTRDIKAVRQDLRDLHEFELEAQAELREYYTKELDDLYEQQAEVRGKLDMLTMRIEAHESNKAARDLRVMNRIDRLEERMDGGF